MVDADRYTEKIFDTDVPIFPPPCLISLLEDRQDNTNAHTDS